MPNAADNASIQAIETLGSTISLLAIVTVYWKQSSEGQANFTSALLLRSLCAFDFILAIFFAIGRAGHLNKDLCIFQGFMIQWFSTAIMLWVVMLSYIMYQWVVVKKHLKRMERTVKRGIAAILVFSFLLALIVLGVGGYGDVYLWCWIEADQPLLRGFTFDFILGLSWCVSLFALRKISTSITERIQSYSLSNHINELLGNNNFSVEKKLTLYIGSFIFIWFFAVLNRAVESALNRPFYPTAVLQALFLSLQGLINSLLYGNIIDLKKFFSIEDMRKVFLGIYASDTRNLKEAVVDPRPQRRQKGTAPAPHQPPLLYSAKEYSIFITTLNMGEAPLESVIGDVKDWIVEGHDIYAIGLQECIDLVGLRELILNHLGGPSKYCMYTTSIGSGNTSLGYHGFIALTVFVKSSEVLAGHVFATKPAAEAAATGTDLIITTAQNKGAVGIALHIHDTSIGFVTCHLPSDSKGKSKLTKRNASAHAILKDVTLAPEDLGFDLHLQHDHVFVFGDLNYRMDTTGAGGGVNSLTGVAVACTIEKSTLSDDANWLARKYNLLRHPSDVLYPSFEEFKLIRTALHDSRGAWSSVLRADELRSIMDDGDAFCGFEEPMPCFPPSYKRRKGKVEGSCGDYTDFSAIIRGYSNTGEVENMLVNQPNVPNKDKKKKEIIAGSIEKVQNFIQRPLSLNTKLTAQEIKNLQSQLNKGNEGSGSDSSPSLSSRQFSADSGESAESEIGGEDDGESGSVTRTGGGNRRRKAAVISTSNFVDPNQPKKETDPSKLRPPSYTDRILLHSLPDRQERVTIQAYDFCDTLRVSDHRAVSMAVRLEVNSAVMFGLLKSGEAEASDRSSYINPPPVLPPLVAPPSPSVCSSQSSTNICTGYTKEPRFELYEVIISELSVCLYDLRDVDEEDDDEPIVYRESHAADDAIVTPSARDMLLRSSSSNLNVHEDNIEQSEDGFISNPMRSSSPIAPSQETASSDRPLSPIARFGTAFFNNGERTVSDHRWKRGGSRVGEESKANSSSPDQNAKGIELLPPSTSRDTYSTSTISTISGGNGLAVSTAMVPNVDLNTNGLNEIIVNCDAPNEPPVPPPRPQLTKSKSSRRKSLFSFFSSDTRREGEVDIAHFLSYSKHLIVP